jgi:serine/threonine protein kinase
MSWKRFSEEPPKTVVSVLKDYEWKKIPFADLTLHRQIGRGGFGEVYFAKWNNTVVAVKKIKWEQTSAGRLDAFCKEIVHCGALNHDNIVKFIGACVETPNVCIVMEYMQMSLYEALHIRNDVDFSNKERLDIVRQVSQGMLYLHSKKIAHCDLKTPNVLMDYTENTICSVKLTDFGLSMVKNDELSSTTNSQELVRNIGTPRYSAPEILRGDLLGAQDMLIADVYSLGLIFLEVIFEEEPFADYKREELKEIVCNKREAPAIRDDDGEKLNQDVRDIMERAWSFEPQKRPTMVEICQVLRSCTSLYSSDT